MTHRTLTTFLTALALLMAGCGEPSDDDNGEQASTCEVPAGSYTAITSDQSGGCSSDVTSELLGGVTKIVIEQGEACGPIEQTTEHVLSDGCVATYTTTARGTATGLDDASATVEVSCDSGPLCSHNLELDYGRQPDDPGCLTDNDCATDERCNLDSGECLFACGSDADCLATESCDEGVTEAGSGGVCVDDDPASVTPDITGLNVQPQTIPQSDIGMTDETLDVSITIDGFTGAIQDANIFVQLDGDQRDAVKDDFQMSGDDTIILVGIQKSLFNGLQPGSYKLGASVSSDAGEQVQELDLATVTITP